MPTPPSSRPLRVLVLCGGSYVSGAEIVALDVMTGLQERGHEVHCLCNAWNDGDFPSRLDAQGIPHTALPLGRISSSLTPKYLRWTLTALLHLPKAYFDYWQCVRQVDPDVVVFNGLVGASTLRPIVTTEPTVHYIHGHPEESVHGRRVFDGFTGPRHAFVGVSKSIRDRLVEVGVDPEQVHTIYNGVSPPGDPPPDTGGDSLNDDAPVVGIVGQVGDWKGHEDLVDALHLLADDGVEAQCVIVGTGEDSFEHHLRSLIDRYGLSDRVHWRGFVHDTDAIYQNMDVCAVPSRFEEPFGLVAAEAGIRGIPVVASRNGGLQEIVVDGETGYLVDAGDPPALADRLERLLSDPERREQFGRAARERVASTFTRTRMVDEVEHLLQSLVHESSSPATLS